MVIVLGNYDPYGPDEQYWGLDSSDELHHHPCCPECSSNTLLDGRWWDDAISPFICRERGLWWPFFMLVQHPPTPVHLFQELVAPVAPEAAATDAIPSALVSSLDPTWCLKHRTLSTQVKQYFIQDNLQTSGGSRAAHMGHCEQTQPLYSITYVTLLWSWSFFIKFEREFCSLLSYFYKVHFLCNNFVRAKNRA